MIVTEHAVDFDSANFIASFLIGTVGFGLFLYGKKQERIPQLVVGLALCGYPYFVTSVTVMVSIAVGLVAGLVFAVRAGW